MKKKYLKLTEEQKKRKVIFSSQLKPGGMMHEVFETDDPKERKIRMLLEDSFFDSSPYKFNEIRK